MKVLLDENLPIDFRHFLPGHAVFTVSFMGWKGIENGDLLAHAAAGGFDVVVSKDAGIEYEQHQSELPISVVLLKAKSNALEDIRPLVPELLELLATLPPRTLRRVG